MPPERHPVEVFRAHPAAIRLGAGLKQAGGMSHLAWEHLNVPQEDMVNMARETGLPPLVCCHHNLILDNCQKMDGWMDGFGISVFEITASTQKQYSIRGTDFHF